jgi:hypothetical protein
MTLWTSLLLALALALAACSAAGVRGAHGEANVPTEAQPAVEAAKEDLRDRMPLTEEPSVASVQAVEWSDTSLGCPQPDMMYAQVITPGYRIVLAAEGQLYVYHATASRAVYCPQDEGRLSELPTDPERPNEGEAGVYFVGD